VPPKRGGTPTYTRATRLPSPEPSFRTSAHEVRLVSPRVITSGTVKEPLALEATAGGGRRVGTPG
jgi:hypothetical protein